MQRLTAAARETRYHPERFLPAPAPAEAAKLAADKAYWITATGPRSVARERARSIRHINEQLQPWVRDVRAQLTQNRSEALAALAREAILGSREYPFPLYPNQILENFLLAIVPASV